IPMPPCFCCNNLPPEKLSPIIVLLSCHCHLTLRVITIFPLSLFYPLFSSLSQCQSLFSHTSSAVSLGVFSFPRSTILFVFVSLLFFFFVLLFLSFSLVFFRSPSFDLISPTISLSLSPSLSLSLSLS